MGEWVKLTLFSQTGQAEYIRIYDFLLDFYNQKAGPMGDSFMSKQSPAAVITGQPGIGQSLDHSHLTYH